MPTRTRYNPLVAILHGGIARNKASYLRDVFGFYLIANGTARRAIDTSHHPGIIPSFSTLNQMLNSMTKLAHQGIKKVAHDPNAVIVYGNFNFMNRICELAGGKHDESVNLTTSLLVAYPELPSLPLVKRINYGNSPYLQLGVIFEGEGTIAGCYKLHGELFKNRLAFREYRERILFIFDDQKTTSFIRRIKHSQLEASQVWEQKKWMLPVPTLFHVDSEESIDVEFRSHGRLMQAVEVLLILHEAVRQGDYGILRDIIPILPVLFQGSKSTNYGPEMLYFAWLLHDTVAKQYGASVAILKADLTHCITTGSNYKAIDLLLEQANASYALDMGCISLCLALVGFATEVPSPGASPY